MRDGQEADEEDQDPHGKPEPGELLTQPSDSHARGVIFGPRLAEKPLGHYWPTVYL